jgi:predicted DNA-binding transcriptional regulator AlpA
MTVPATPMRAEQTYKAEEVARLLGISRATFFRLAWFKARKVRTSAGTVGYLASDVALYQSLRRGQ